MQVWIMIFVSILATVGLMTFHSWYYGRFDVKNVHTDPSVNKVRNKLVFQYFSFHMIYVLNIMTNQGNRSFILLLYICDNLKFVTIFTNN